MKSEVYLLGGSLGELCTRAKVVEPVETFDNVADARSFAKRRNRLLSPGEKKHYKMKYVVRTTK